MSILQFTRNKGAWTCDELKAIAEMQRVLEERGVRTSFESGIADGDVPWVTLHDQRTDSFVLHVARDGAYYILICSDRTKERSPRLDRLIETVRNRCQHGPWHGDWHLRKRGA